MGSKKKLAAKADAEKDDSPGKKKKAGKLFGKQPKGKAKAKAKAKAKKHDPLAIGDWGDWAFALQKQFHT